MKKYLLFILLGTLTSTGSFAQSASDAQVPQEFAAIYTTGEKWDASKSPAEQEYFLDHSAFLFRLKQKGMITAGLRVADKGIILFKAATIEEARKIFEADVSVSEQTFNVEIQPATVFYKGCL